MKSSELFELAQKINSIEGLIKAEPRIVSGITSFIEDEISMFRLPEDKRKDLINKVVNSFAATLRDEIGLMNSESCKILERIRIVRDTTVRSNKKKADPAVSGKINK